MCHCCFGFCSMSEVEAVVVGSAVRSVRVSQLSHERDSKKRDTVRISSLGTKFQNGVSLHELDTTCLLPSYFNSCRFLPPCMLMIVFSDFGFPAFFSFLPHHQNHLQPFELSLLNGSDIHYCLCYRKHDPTT